MRSRAAAKETSQMDVVCRKARAVHLGVIWQHASFLNRHLIVYAAIELAAVGTFGAPHSVGTVASPLLKEKRYASRFALIANGPHPGGIHRARLRARLAADDDPRDTVEVERAKVLE
jgi:hypothetical protein